MRFSLELEFKGSKKFRLNGVSETFHVKAPIFEPNGKPNALQLNR